MYILEIDRLAGGLVQQFDLASRQMQKAAEEMEKAAIVSPAPLPPRRLRASRPFLLLFRLERACVHRGRGGGMGLMSMRACRRVCTCLEPFTGCFALTGFLSQLASTGLPPPHSLSCIFPVSQLSTSHHVDGYDGWAGHEHGPPDDAGGDGAGKPAVRGAGRDPQHGERGVAGAGPGPAPLPGDREGTVQQGQPREKRRRDWLISRLLDPLGVPGYRNY